MAGERRKEERFDAAERNSCRKKVIVFFLAPFLLIVTSLVFFFIIREDRMGREAQLSELTESAGAFVEQIAVARFWNARHGGLYAEITPDTQPNPYLTSEDRDVVSLDGRRFTKINPAYMTRQLSQIADKRQGYKFRIIGLRPLNPENAPERWEKDALESLVKTGVPFVSSVRREGGASFFNYLVPLRIEEPCLGCHVNQGYRTGDVKGGIVVRIPMEKYGAIRQEWSRKTVLSLSAVGMAGIVLAVLTTLYLSRRLDREIQKNIEREKKTAAIELAGAAAHELRQPLTVILCTQYAIRDKLSRGEAVSDEEMQILSSQCLRMNGIIERMLNVISYKTKPYDRGVSILDLEACSSGERRRDPST